MFLFKRQIIFFIIGVNLLAVGPATGEISQNNSDSTLSPNISLENPLLQGIYTQLSKLELQREYLLPLQSSLRESPIRFVDIHPTNKCNLSCNDCTYKTIERDRHMPFDAIRRLSSLHPKEILIVGGGEPTLYKDEDKTFNDFVLELRRIAPNANLKLTTNGLIVPTGGWQKEMSFVSISLHGYSSESFLKYTNTKNPALFETVINNIFQKYYLETPINDIKVSFVYSAEESMKIIPLIRRLFHEWKQAEEVLQKKGVQKTFDFILQPLVDDNKPANPYQYSNLSQNEKSLLRNNLAQIRQKEPELWEFISNHAKDILEKPFTDFKAPGAKNCLMANDYVIMSAESLFYPCCVMNGVARKWNYGSIHQNDLKLKLAREKHSNNIPSRCKISCRLLNTYMGSLLKQSLNNPVNYSI